MLEQDSLIFIGCIDFALADSEINDALRPPRISRLIGAVRNRYGDWYWGAGMDRREGHMSNAFHRDVPRNAADGVFSRSQALGVTDGILE